MKCKYLHRVQAFVLQWKISVFDTPIDFGHHNANNKEDTIYADTPLRIANCQSNQYY